MRCLGATFLLLASLQSTARAELYEFTITGTMAVIEGIPPVNINVGDPFTIRYRADSTDLDPNPRFGRYNATTATISFPIATLESPHSLLPDVKIHRDASFLNPTIYYVDHDGIDNDLRVEFYIPPPLVTSDELPLSIDVGASDPFARFRYFNFYPH